VRLLKEKKESKKERKRGRDETEREREGHGGGGRVDSSPRLEEIVRAREVRVGRYSAWRRRGKDPWEREREKEREEKEERERKKEPARADSGWSRFPPAPHGNPTAQARLRREVRCARKRREKTLLSTGKRGKRERGMWFD